MKEDISRTIAIFQKMLGRPLTMRESNQCRTDGTVVEVNLKDPLAYYKTENGLAHIYLGTDEVAKNDFIQAYSTDVVSACMKDGVILNHENFAAQLHLMTGALDDFRVLSAWENLYRGSYNYIREMIQTEIRSVQHDPNVNILGLLLWLTHFDEIPTGAMDLYRGTLLEAMRKVDGKAFSSVLSSTKWLLTQLVTIELAKNSSNNRAEALQNLSNGLGKQTNVFSSTVAPTVQTKEAAQHSTDLVRQAASGKAESDLELEDHPQTHTNNTDYEPMNAKLVFHDASVGIAAPMSITDQVAADQLQCILQRIIGRNRSTLGDIGFEIDTLAQLERRTSGRPVSIFKQITKRRGFNALILVDKSRSMRGWSWIKEARPPYWRFFPDSELGQAYRGSRILTRALSSLDTVDLEMWGWTSLLPGTVDILKFPKDLDIDHDENPEFKGDTPIPHVLRAAREYLRGKRGTSHIYLLTDGDPSYKFRDGSMCEDPFKATEEEVAACRAWGVGLTIICLGNDKYKELIGKPYRAASAFTILNSENLAHGMVELIGNDLTTFLRRR